MKDYNSDFKKLVEKYKLQRPLEPGMRQELVDNRKSSLLNFLKKIERDNLYTRMFISLNIMLRNIGVRLPNRGRALSYKSLSFALAGFAGIIVIAGMLYSIDITKYFLPGQKAVITFVKGKVEATNRAEEFRPLELGDNIDEQDIIITGPGSYVAVQIGDKAQVLIQGNSTLRISSLFDNDITALYLSNGSIISNVIRINENSRFKISTRNIIATALGTRFEVSYGDDVSSVSITKGRVHVRHLGEDGYKDDTELDKGKTAVVAEKTTVRPIEKREELIVKRITQIPIVSGGDINKSILEKNAIQFEENLKQIDNEINKEEVLKKDNKRRKRKATLDDLRKKYGRLVRIITKDGREYIGAFRQAGTETEIITTKRRFKIPSTQILKIITY